MISDQAISVTIPADVAWVPLVQAAAENGTGVFALASDKALRLTMAVEELLVHLAEALPGEAVTFTIRPGSTYVAVDAEFASVGIDLSVLNITSSPGDSGQDVFATMPLLLASRMTDGFHVESLPGKTRITLQVDRVYPEIDVQTVERRDVRGDLLIVPASEPAVIREACIAAHGLYPARQLPVWLRTPGRVADMAAAGEIDILLALDASNAVCGMVCWEMPSDQSAAFYGPYTFTGDTSVPGLLMEAMVVALGRTSAKIVYSNVATGDASQYGFELLGEVEYSSPDGSSAPLPVWFRELREDFGASVRVHADIVPFLEEQYERHVLMRDIRITEDMGERVAGKSVFSTRLSRELREAVLKPVLNGADTAENLRRHVDALRAENFRNIFFNVDLSSGWQGALCGDLLATGFIPALLLPHGGQSDVVMFRYVEPSA